MEKENKKYEYGYRLKELRKNSGVKKIWKSYVRFLLKNMA